MDYLNYSNVYISGGCNQTPTAVDWGKNNLICYGSCNCVLLYDPKYGSGGKIIKTLYKHQKRVNSVRWIAGVDHETELISASSDGTAIVWTLNDDGSLSNYVLAGHKGTVNIVDGLYKDTDKKYAVVGTASVDSTVRIWSRFSSSDDFVMTQCLNFGHGLSTALKLSLLPNSNSLILATGLDNCHIQLYTQNEEVQGVSFNKSIILKGHENWIRGLDFTVDEKGDLLLASSSQDAFIRLWRITDVDLSETETIDVLSSQKPYLINCNGATYSVLLESVLAGHEGWVYSVSWSPTGLKLLSASLDKSMVVWEFDLCTGLWLENVRVGEIGGNTLGFYGGIFGPDGLQILAHGYHGAFHIWNFSEETQSWEPQVTIGGHFNEVTDLAWEPKGEFLMSISRDQSTRIHAPWSKDDHKVTWHEIARPQVHGYDLSCLAIISRYKFASGAEEKIIRTFKAPRNFVENFRRVCMVEDDKEGDKICQSTKLRPQGASVPSLGLSNKAVFENDNSAQAQRKSDKEVYPEESYFTAVNLTEPPTEEMLLQNTLWPEVQKLYGHGYELHSLAASPDGTLLASACKATTSEHAAILLWEVASWKQIQKLPSHTLTISQMAFSPDSQSLLSVSRDRRWSLFSRNDETNQFELAATTDKKTGIHSRIIWSCAWSHDSKYFATGSRDGKVVIWTKNLKKIKQDVLGQYEAVCKPLELKGESITALAFAPLLIASWYLLAVGLDSGAVLIYKWNLLEWKEVLKLDKIAAHHLTVKRLAFRPHVGEAGDENIDSNILQLASCGCDHSVKVYNLYTSSLKYVLC